MDIYELVSAISDFIDREQFPDLDDFDEEDMQDYLFEEFEPLQLFAERFRVFQIEFFMQTRPKSNLQIWFITYPVEIFSVAQCKQQ